MEFQDTNWQISTIIQNPKEAQLALTDEKHQNASFRLNEDPSCLLFVNVNIQGTAAGNAGSAEGGIMARICMEN